MEATISFIRTSSAEVVTLEEQEGEQSSQTVEHLNSQMLLNQGHSFDSFFEVASAPATLQSVAAQSASAKVLDRNSGAMSGGKISTIDEQKSPIDGGTGDENVHARDKQFSSSSNDEASPVICAQH